MLDVVFAFTKRPVTNKARNSISSIDEDQYEMHHLDFL